MSEAGLPGDQHIGYYRERALGGAGMIVVEPVPVHPTGVLTRGNFRVDDDAVVPHFRRLTESCHEAAAADGGVVMIHQLYHVGQHGDADNSFAPSWSPSGLPSYHDADGSHAMTEAEIGELIDGFERAAVRATGQRLRRRRAVRGLPRRHRPVLDALVEPADRRLGRHLRGPHALLVHAARAHPGRLRRRLHRRAGGQPRSGIARLADGRAAPGGGGLARRAGADGLRHLRHGELLRLLQPDPDIALPGPPR